MDFLSALTHKTRRNSFNVESRPSISISPDGTVSLSRPCSLDNGGIHCPDNDNDKLERTPFLNDNHLLTGVNIDSPRRRSYIAPHNLPSIEISLVRSASYNPPRIPAISISPDVSIPGSPALSCSDAPGHYIDDDTEALLAPDQPPFLGGSFLSLNVPNFRPQTNFLVRSSSAVALRNALFDPDYEGKFGCNMSKCLSCIFNQILEPAEKLIGVTGYHFLCSDGGKQDKR